MKRIALALIVCLWASLAFGQAPAQQFQQGLIGSGNAGYPPGSTAFASGATGTTAGTAVNIQAAAGQFTYACGFSVSPGSATAAITISVTMINLVGGTNTWFIGAPVTAAGTTGAIFSQTFWPCLRSSTPNAQIVVSAGALGAGGVNQTVNVWGYGE